MASSATYGCDQLANATALSCTSYSKTEQTSPTAGEPAACSGVKSSSPTSTKKAWRQRLEVEDALAAASAALATIPPTPAEASGAVTSYVDVKPEVESAAAADASGLRQSQLFVCRQCGKCFITLKYLEMHSALHACQLSTALPVAPPIQPHPNPPRPTPTQDRVLIPDQRTVPPTKPDPGRPLDLGRTLPVVQLLGGAATSASAAPTPSRYRDWTCDICHKTFSQNSSYKNHQRTHSDERPFVCTVCSIGFKERYHLKKHTLFKHSSEAREQCRVCGKRFKDTTAVRAHERIHSDIRPYSCRRCRKAFKTSECLWHHENRSKSCGGVASLFETADSDEAVHRRGRKRARVDVGLLPVSGQPLTSGDSKSYDIIPSGIKEEDVPELTAAGGPVRLLNVPTVCPTPLLTNAATTNSVIAAQTSGILDRLQEVISSASLPEFGATRDVGNSQQMATVHNSASMDHLDTVHISRRTAGGAGGGHREGLVLLANCAVSRPDDVTSTPTQVKVEPEVVLADYELTAMRSPESSFYERKRMAAAETTPGAYTTTPATLSNLEMEVATETGSRSPPVSPPTVVIGSQLECRECGRFFASRVAYNKHAVVHREERPHRCEECDVGFKLRVHLKKHNLYRHSDDYHCECRHCGKRCKDSSAMRLHERIHSADRPFRCPTCEKTFKTRENLWGHRHRGPCGHNLMQSVAAMRHVNDIGSSGALMQPCLGVEEQLEVDSEVEVHGCDIIQPPSNSDALPAVPTPAARDNPSVAVVEPGHPKAVLWTCGRAAFYVTPSMLSNVPTAVVAPIKREVPDEVAHPTGPCSVVPDSQVLPTQGHQPNLSKAHLPPFETFRSHASSAPGTTSMTSSTSVATSSPTTASVRPELVHQMPEAVPLTSFYRHPLALTPGAFPFPVPIVAFADVGTQWRRTAGNLRASGPDRLVLSAPVKMGDCHVAAQPLPVPSATVAQSVSQAAARCVVSNANEIRN